MGGICPCPCPKRHRQKPFPYDVHEETFEIEEKVQNIGEHSPKNGHHDPDNNILTEQLRSSDNDRSGFHQDQAPIQQTSTNQFTDQQPKKSQASEPLKPLISQEAILETEILIKTEKIQQQKKVEELPKFQANILKPKAPRKKYNPDDYRFLNENGAFKVKKIDSIKEQQFNIQNCKDSFFFIFDITANLYIDDTDNCFIFIAPCESTIFVRNCKNMTIIAATKQFRTYECHHSRFSLYCKSQPVIESSSQLVFTSFYWPIYEELSQQLRKKKLEPWNNHWSEIHNFTKKQGERHFRLEESIDLSGVNWKQAFNEAELPLSQKQNPIPLIIGDLPYESKKQVLIMMNKNVQDEVIIRSLKGAVILKGFQGVIPGEGKDEKKVVLIDALDNIVQKYEQLGSVYSDSNDIELHKTKWFVSFGDEREK